MKHPLVELTNLVSASIPSSEWENDPIAKKQGIKSLSQAIKSKAARVGIHKINNILNVKIPIPVSAIERAAHQVNSNDTSYDLDPVVVRRMLEDFMSEIDNAATNDVPQRIVKQSTGMYHGANEPEHAFKDSAGTFKKSSEPVVMLLDYARALYLVANRFHSQISN